MRCCFATVDKGPKLLAGDLPRHDLKRSTKRGAQRKSHCQLIERGSQCYADARTNRDADASVRVSSCGFLFVAHARTINSIRAAEAKYGDLCGN